MAELSPETQANLHSQLVKLGDMMGDGLHLESDGKWISRDYRKTLKALCLMPKQKRANNSALINEKMAERLKQLNCPNCNAGLKQVRSGSMKATCSGCGSKYTLLSRKKSKRK